MSVPRGYQRHIFRDNLAPTFAEHKQSSQVAQAGSYPTEISILPQSPHLVPPILVWKNVLIRPLQTETFQMTRAN